MIEYPRDYHAGAVLIDPREQPQDEIGFNNALIIELQTSLRVVRTVTASPDTLTATDEIVLVDVPGGATINLPAGVKGRRYDIKRLNAPPGQVTITPNGVEQIDNAANVILTARYVSVTLVSDGANWWII